MYVNKTKYVVKIGLSFKTRSRLEFRDLCGNEKHLI